MHEIIVQSRQTGKTTELIRRMVEHVLTSRDPVHITFVTIHQQEAQRVEELFWDQIIDVHDVEYKVTALFTTYDYVRRRAGARSGPVFFDNIDMYLQWLAGAGYFHTGTMSMLVKRADSTRAPHARLAPMDHARLTPLDRMQAEDRLLHTSAEYAPIFDTEWELPERNYTDYQDTGEKHD